MDKQTFYELARLHELWLDNKDGGRKLELKNAKLEHFHIHGLRLDEADFENCYFNLHISSCDFDRAFFQNCYFQYCGFDDVDMPSVTFETCNFDGCTFNDAYFAYSYMKHVIFAETVLINCVFDYASVTFSYFINEDLSKTDWYQTDRNSTIFTGGFNGNVD